jgi:hypothetical protein
MTVADFSDDDPIISISPGAQVTAQDIAQFDARWMGAARLQRLADYDWELKNRRAYIAWGIGDDTSAMVRLFELTHDRKYLDHLRDVDNIALHYRDDNHPGDDFPRGGNPICMNCRPPFVDRVRGKVEPAWGSGIIYTDYVDDGGLTPVDTVTSGVYTYGIAAFARLVAEDPSLQADYGADAVRFANAAMQTMWAFMPQFDARQVDSYLEGTFNRPSLFPTSAQCKQAHDDAIAYVRQFSGENEAGLADLRKHIDQAKSNCERASNYAGKPLAHNESGALVMSFIELWRALDSDFYRRSPQAASDAELTRGLIPLIVARHQRYFVNRLKVENDAAQGQRYGWHYNDDVPDPHIEDTSHGNLDMSYLNVLRHSFDRLNAKVAPSGEPIPLDDAMVRCFANTFLEQIARPDEIDRGGNLRSDVDGRSAADSGKGGPDYNNPVCDGWVTLASVDATIYRLCRDVSLRLGVRPCKPGVFQNYLTIANHAALLANKGFSRQVTDLDLTRKSGSVPAASDPFGWVFAAQEVQNVAFRGTDGHVYELWRTASGIGYTDLSGLAGAPPATGDPKAYDFPALGTHNVVYRGTDGHLHGLYWTTGPVGHDDLTQLSGAPGPAGNPFPYVSPAFGVQNVMYRAGNGHLHGLYWSTGAVGHDDLTALSGAPAAAGDPSGYFINAEAIQDVFYRGTDDHLHRLFWSLGAVSHQDLTTRSGAPGPAGDPTAYVTPSGQQNVFYRGADGHIHGLYWTNGAIGHDDLSRGTGGAPLPVGDPAAYFNAQNNTHHVIYRTSNGHLHELTWTTGAVTHTDLTTVALALPFAGKPSGYVFGPNGSPHVIYRASDGHLHDLTGEPATIKTVIDLNGRWTDGSTRSAVISAAFTSLTIDMSAYHRPAAYGSIVDDFTITVTFPDDATYTGTLQPPNTIRWSNGSAWTKI